MIDIQNFYFPGGRSELVEPVQAAEKAAIAIAHARTENSPVIFIQHKSAAGMEINDLVKPAPGEAVFIKEEVNSFLGTGLTEHIKILMSTHWLYAGCRRRCVLRLQCVLPSDLGYYVFLLHDACATRNLKFGDREVPAADVHASTLATMKSYASVRSVEEWTNEYFFFLKKKKKKKKKKRRSAVVI